MEERYSRQMMIDQIGEEGQKKLAESSIMVVGAGGLGSPALTYLASAGVGNLGIVDSDTVALSNLNRQFLHNIGDIGRSKADSAKEKLSNLNNEVKIISFNKHLTVQNAKDILNGYDIVLGAVDSFETRFIINKTCVSLGIPYIDGGVDGFSGCVLFSNPPHTPCLNCVFHHTSAGSFAGNSGKKKTIGVLGTTAGVVGTIKANTAILHLLNLPNPLVNKLLMYDGLRQNIDYIEIKRNKDCPVCK